MRSITPKLSHRLVYQGELRRAIDRIRREVLARREAEHAIACAASLARIEASRSDARFDAACGQGRR